MKTLIPIDWIWFFLFFIFIDNRTFIEKKNIMFIMMNTMDMKKIHKAQELKLTANKL